MWQKLLRWLIRFLSKLQKPLPILTNSNSKVFTSFSGIDIIATINTKRVGEIQGISYSINRTSFRKTNNKKITGTMIFILFDRHALASCLNVTPNQISCAIDVPPFDIELTGINELGNAMYMKILGCQITSEGQSITVDDIINEQIFTYIAKDITPWHYKGKPCPNCAAILYRDRTPIYVMDSSRPEDFAKGQRYYCCNCLKQYKNIDNHLIEITK